jgi:putative ABC transport system substrate-binding protein
MNRRTFIGSIAGAFSRRRSLFNETEAAASKLGLTALPLDIQFPEGVEPAFAEAVRLRANAVVIISDGATIVHRAQLGSAALQHRLPTIFANKVYLEGGGLMSYGPDIIAVWRRAATYVDRILKGAKPVDIADRTAHQFRARHQSQDRRGTGARDPAGAAAAGGRANSVIERFRLFAAFARLASLVG